MINLFLGPRFSYILIKEAKQTENIALKHEFCHIFLGLHILSTAVAYLRVIAFQHFSNDPHDEINTGNCPVLVPFNTLDSRGKYPTLPPFWLHFSKLSAILRI